MLDITVIEKLRKEKELSHYKLAHLVGISTAHMTKLMSGKINDPRFQLVCRFADVLEVKVDDLRKPVNYER